MRNLIIALAAGLVLFSMLATARAQVASLYAKTANYFLLRCNSMTDAASCASAGCYWYNGMCNTSPEGIGETDYCIRLDEDIQLCFTDLNTKYLIVSMGEYGEAIDV
jgi:diphthamide synthase (EF-2-diphthine--ammonia ligase)